MRSEHTGMCYYYKQHGAVSGRVWHIHLLLREMYVFGE